MSGARAQVELGERELWCGRQAEHARAKRETEDARAFGRELVCIPKREGGMGGESRVVSGLLRATRRERARRDVLRR